MKKLLLSVVTVLVFSIGYAQNPLWQKANANRVAVSAKLERASNPVDYDLYTLNLPALKSMLQAAPSRESLQYSDVVIPFPSGDGTIKN